MVVDCWDRVECGGMAMLKRFGMLSCGCVDMVTVGRRACSTGYWRSAVGGKRVGAV